MAREDVQIVLDIRGADRVTRDADQTARRIDRLGDSADRAGRKGSLMGRLFAGAGQGLGAVGRVAAGAVGAIARIGVVGGAAAVVAGASFIRMASDAGEVQSAFEVTFGAGTAAVQEFVDSTAALSGQTTADIQSAVNTFGSFAKAAGIADADVAGFATSLVGAANDIGSFKNADPTQVMEDMQSALSGSIEPMRKYGIFMSDAALSTQSAAMGMGDAFSELSEGDKVMVRQAFIMSNLGDAAGDLARTAESPANTFRFLAGRGREAMTMLGQGLLPAVVALTPTLRDLATKGLQFVTDKLPALQAWSGRVGERLATMISGDIPTAWTRLGAAMDDFSRGEAAGVGVLVDQAFGGSGRMRGPVEWLVTTFHRMRDLAGDVRRGVAGLVDRLGGFEQIMAKVRDVGGQVRDVAMTVVGHFRDLMATSGDTAPQMATLADTMAGPLKVGMETAESVLPVINSAFQWMGDHAETLGPAIAAVAGGLLLMRGGGVAANSALAPIGGLRGAIAGVQLVTAGLGVATQVLARANNVNAVATNASTAATGRGTIATAASKVATIASNVATRAWAAGQWLLNAALTANPIGLVIAAIALLVGAFVLAWNNSETFRTVVTAAFERVKQYAETAFNWVKDNWQLLLAILTGPIGLAVLAITTHWDTIKGGFEAAWDGIVDAFGSARDLMDGIWGSIKSGAAAAVNFIIGKINDVIETANAALRAVDAVTPGSLPQISTLSEVSFRAEGGPLAAGQVSVVGEDGPELFVPDRSGTVIPNGATFGANAGTTVGKVVINLAPGQTRGQGAKAAREFAITLGRLVEGEVAWA